MSFTPEYTPQKFVPVSPPAFPEASKRHMENEIRRISQTIDRLVDAVREIQEHLENMP